MRLRLTASIAGATAWLSPAGGIPLTEQARSLHLIFGIRVFCLNIIFLTVLAGPTASIAGATAWLSPAGGIPLTEQARSLHLFG